MKFLSQKIKILLAFLFVLSCTSVAQNKISVSPLGFGAAKIILNKTIIYTDLAETNIDTNNLNQYSDANILLISHADWDHFSAKWIAKISKISGAKIIGPPSISYSLLADYNVQKEQLMVFYPNQPENPIDTIIQNIKFRIYQTEHFNGWKPVHISYLIEFNGKTIYFAGDSYSNMLSEPSFLPKEIDIVIANFVEGTDDVAKYTSKFQQVHSNLLYKYLLPLHLINCDFTIDPEYLKENMTKQSLLKIKLCTKKGHDFNIN